MIIGNYRPSTNTLSRMDLCTLIDTLSISCGLSEGGGVYSVYIYIDYKYVSNVNVFVLFIHLAGRGRGYIIIEVYNHVN